MKSKLSQPLGADAPTPREMSLEELADKEKDVKPQLYDITSKNLKAMRVVHDWSGNAIGIPPGQTKKQVLLHPNAAEALGKGDLEVSASA